MCFPARALRSPFFVREGARRRATPPTEQDAVIAVDLTCDVR